MTDVTELLRGGGSAPAQRQIVPGYVSTSKPAPTAFTDPLYVVIPDFSADFSEPVEWAALHGATLPAQGAQVLVTFDTRNQPYAVWWDGPGIVAPTWSEIAAGSFASPWTNFGGTEETLGYRIDSLGNVQLKGRVKGQTATGTQSITAAAAFPVPYNAKHKPFLVVCAGPSGATGFVAINGNGSLELSGYPSSGTAAITSWVDLSAVRYTTT